MASGRCGMSSVRHSCRRRGTDRIVEIGGVRGLATDDCMCIVSLADTVELEHNLHRRLFAPGNRYNRQFFPS